MLSQFGALVSTDFKVQALEFCASQKLYHLVSADAINLPFRDEAFDAAVMFDVLEHLEDDLRVFGVQVAGRFVGQQNRGLVDDGPCQRHPLLLASGELGGLVGQLVFQTQNPEKLPPPQSAFGRVGSIVS